VGAVAVGLAEEDVFRRPHRSALGFSRAAMLIAPRTHAKVCVSVCDATMTANALIEQELCCRCWTGRIVGTGSAWMRLSNSDFLW